MASLDEIVSYTDRFLRIRDVGDWDNALNGLQIENSGRMTKIGAAVDASGATFQMAVDREIDLLLVHHGFFWPGLRAITGPFCRALKLAPEEVAFLISADLFACGLATLVQCIGFPGVGIRLPVMMGVCT